MTTLAQEAQAGFEQCVVFVEHVTGVGYGLPTAASYLTKYSSALHSAPRVGDIAIWGPYQGGAQSAGHVAVVTSVSPSGAPTVLGTNWPEGSGAVSHVAGAGGMGLPTAYLTPSDAGGAAPAAPDVTGGAGNAATYTTTGGGYRTLSQAMSDTGLLHLGAPSAFFSWLTQGSLLRRIGFTLTALVLLAIGVYLLVRRDSDPTVGAQFAKLTRAAEMA